MRRRGATLGSTVTERVSGPTRVRVRCRHGAEAILLSGRLTISLEPSIGFGPSVGLLAGGARRSIIPELACIPALCIRLKAGGEAFARHLTSVPHAPRFALALPRHPTNPP